MGKYGTFFKKVIVWGIISISMSVAVANADICRPVGSDISIARSCTNYFYAFEGETADQSTRDCLESYARKTAVDFIILAKDLAPNGTKAAINGLTLSLTRTEVIPPYRGSLQNPGGAIWDYAHHPAGRDYQVWCTSFRTIASELGSASKRAAASERFANSPNLRLVLNKNETFSGPSGVPLDSPPLDTDKASLFPIDTTSNGPQFLPCATGDCSDLQDVDDAHVCDVDKKLGRPVTPLCQSLLDRGVSVSSALAAYEAGCPEDDGDCKWFRRLPPFPGSIDPNLSAAAKAQWPQITDIFHHKWVEGERAGDAKSTQLDGFRHFIAHVCQAIGSDARLKVVIPADNIESKNFSQSYGGDQTCASILPKLVAAYNIN